MYIVNKIEYIDRYGKYIIIRKPVKTANVNKLRNRLVSEGAVNINLVYEEIPKK